MISRERPIIGITMRHELETERFYLARAYSEAVEACGGVPIHISLIPKKEYISAAIGVCDGVLLPGSASDVDPLLYGREPQRGLGAVHPLRDETDLLALAEIERSGMPLLAICFGMQSLNVSRGGTLIQDIGSARADSLKHEQGSPRGRRSHRITFAADSKTARLAGAASALVNSHHHQAVETVGENLRATAWAADGIIEAIEDARAERWVIGVQWHPEIEWADDALATGLFREFVRQAKRYMERVRLDFETVVQSQQCASDKDKGANRSALTFNAKLNAS
jgi:putative glutamine amidotransferase